MFVPTTVHSSEVGPDQNNPLAMPALHRATGLTRHTSERGGALGLDTHGPCVASDPAPTTPDVVPSTTDGRPVGDPDRLADEGGLASDIDATGEARGSVGTAFLSHGGSERPRPSTRPRIGEVVHVTRHDLGSLTTLIWILARLRVDPAACPPVRLVLTLASCVPTSCVLGLDLARREDDGAGARVLAQVGASKDAVAREAGCREGWRMVRRPARVVTDHSTYWHRGAFRDAVEVLGAEHVTSSGACAFRHVADDLVRRLLQPAEADRFEGHRRAKVIGVDPGTGGPVHPLVLATRLVVRRVCDDHHTRRSHRIGGMTPAAAWRRGS